MDDETRTAKGVYVEAGEDVNPDRTFSADEVSDAFGVDRKRVGRAMAGELGLGESQPLRSKDAQRLVEVLLGDRPMDEREAALMKLGAFTPRRDADWGLGSGPPNEESDRQSAQAGTPDDELASERSSHAPSMPSSG
jgi:hypothetical protein